MLETTKRTSLVVALVVSAGCARGIEDFDAAGTDAGRSDARRDTGPMVCMTEAPDEPDADNFDANCDGIDGDVAQAIFVTPGGDDSGPGTRALPYRTLRHALSQANLMGKTQILVSTGDYTETSTLRLIDGVGIYGGYDRASNWARGSGASNLAGAEIAIATLGLRHPTTIARLNVRAADATSDGGVSIAIRAVDSSSLVIVDHANLTAGRGRNGVNGQPGVNGAEGAVGGQGGNGSGDNQAAPGPGGGGGQNPQCPTANGGAGGRGGRDPEFRGESGFVAAAGAIGGNGGTTTGCTGVSGSPGTTGSADGARGNGGMPGAATGTINATTFVYEPANGGDGAAGMPGGGGGGGGGSSGQTSTACIDGAGNGGGGGGAGGCGGQGGTGGGGGGASIGVLAIRSALRVDGITITTAGGGTGGAGGAGGMSGAAGTGAAGGNAATSEVGAGGRGGDGRRGGEGGAGAGGGGGASIGIWKDAMMPNVANVMYQLGEPGAGGTSPAGAPSAGVRGAQMQVGP